MTDVSEGSGPIPRRTSRATDGGAPVSGALAIVLAVVAVVAGFLILQSISGDDERQLDILPGEGAGVEATAGDGGVGTTQPAVVTPTVPPATTQPTIIASGAAVVVANASKIAGSAAEMSRALQLTYGFTMGEPTNAAAVETALTTSTVYYDTTQVAAKVVADSVVLALGGGVNVQPMPSPPPVESGDIAGAGVLLILGTDKAGKTLEELNPTAAVTPAVTNPVVGATPGTTAAPGA